MTQEDIVILSQLLDQKFEPVYTRLDSLERDVAELKSDVSTLKSDVSTLKSDVSTLKSDVAELKSDVSTLKSEVNTLKSNVSALNDRVAQLNQRVTNLELMIENETNVNIRRIAEGHCDLVRNLREARKVDDEKELLAIRVTVLESDMSKVKRQLAIT